MRPVSEKNLSISAAASMMSILNASFDVFALAGIQEFLDYSNTQYLAMTTAQVALFYVALNESSIKLPAVVKLRVDVAKFDTPRVLPGDNWITTAEMVAARTQLATISQGVVEGKNFNLSQALAYIQAQSTKDAQE